MVSTDTIENQHVTQDEFFEMTAALDCVVIVVRRFAEHQLRFPPTLPFPFRNQPLTSTRREVLTEIIHITEKLHSIHWGISFVFLKTVSTKELPFFVSTPTPTSLSRTQVCRPFALESSEG